MFSREIENDLIENAEKNNYGIITFSPLSQGVLSEKFINGKQSNPALSRTNLKLPGDEQIKKIQMLNGIASKRNQSLSQMALSWNLRLSVICSVLTAVSSIEQLDNTLKILDSLNFTEDELSKIDDILK